MDGLAGGASEERDVVAVAHVSGGFGLDCHAECARDAEDEGDPRGAVHRGCASLTHRTHFSPIPTSSSCDLCHAGLSRAYPDPRAVSRQGLGPPRDSPRVTRPRRRRGRTPDETLARYGVGRSAGRSFQRASEQGVKRALISDAEIFLAGLSSRFESQRGRPGLTRARTRGRPSTSRPAERDPVRTASHRRNPATSHLRRSPSSSGSEAPFSCGHPSRETRTRW